MDNFWVAAMAVLGLAVGSFLNVAINRLKEGKSLGGRSACPHCRHELSAWDLVPVLSFIFLGGKCRYCGRPISWQYPLVELATALAFLLVAAKFPPGPEALFALVLAAYLIVIGVYDYKHYLLLDKLVFPGFLVSLTYALYRDFSLGCQPGLNLSCATVSGLAGILCISGFFYLQYAISNGRWIGFGDVKFGLMLGMLAGFPLAMFLLFFSYVAGSLAAAVLLALGRKQMGSRLPFGTFLAFSALTTLLYGHGLLGQYLELIGL